MSSDSFKNTDPVTAPPNNGDPNNENTNPQPVRPVIAPPPSAPPSNGIFAQQQWNRQREQSESSQRSIASPSSVLPPSAPPTNEIIAEQKGLIPREQSPRIDPYRQYRSPDLRKEALGRPLPKDMPVKTRKLRNTEPVEESAVPPPSNVPTNVKKDAVPQPPPSEEKSEPGIFSRLMTSGMSAITASATQDGGGMAIWNFFNALAFIILITLIFIGIVYALSGTASIAQIKANWDKHRCDPSVMPFAALYGHNTSENFNYCLGNIFDTKSLDITGPFSTVLGSFTSLLKMMMNSINSLRVGVATIGGGINVMFQDFTDRISTFFFQLRLSAIRIKALIGRMYAIMFAVMYMGLSGITGMTSFSNTVLFKFLDTFCFTPDTEVEIIREGEDTPVKVPILEVKIGDVLLPTKSRVSSKFHFAANGQPMVVLFDEATNHYVHVSSNHYLAHEGKWIRAEDHPDALTSPQAYHGNSLICLNTSDHVIPIGNYRFRDYDETEDNNVDEKTMRFIEHTINGEQNIAKEPQSSYPFREYYPAIDPKTQLRLANGKTQSIGEITLGTRLSTGCTVIGKVHREVTEYCLMPHGISSSTLVWNKKDSRWQRAATMSKLWTTKATPVVFTSLFVSPSSIIELADGTMIRDSMELCSPDAELYYAQQLKQLKT